MNIMDFVRKYMEENGYTALCSNSCGCTIDDLAPCDSWFGSCLFGYANNCETCAKQETCSDTQIDDGFEILCWAINCWQDKESKVSLTDVTNVNESR